MAYNIEVLTQRKPPRWSLTPGEVTADWQWAWLGMKICFPFWEGSPIRSTTNETAPYAMDLVSRRLGDKAGGTGTWGWAGSPMGTTANITGSYETAIKLPQSIVNVSGLQSDAWSAFAYARLDNQGSGFPTIITGGDLSGGSKPMFLLVETSTGKLWEWQKANVTLPVNPNTDRKWHTYGVSHGPGEAKADLRFYFDGLYQGTPTTDTGSWTAGGTNWAVGGIGGTHGWMGPMAVCYLWNRKLTDGEHARLAVDPFGPLRPTWLESIRP